tara:strand:- start:810 stop:998 length:189 start_codon:yes stop_codon:yes gene_type:complete
LKGGRISDPTVASRITLYILAKELHISPAEAYQMPYSLVRDLMVLFAINKEAEAEEMKKVKL